MTNSSTQPLVIQLQYFSHLLESIQLVSLWMPLIIG